MGTAILVLGLFTVFAGLAIMVMATGVLSTERSGVSRSLAAIEAIGSLPDSSRQQLEPSFMDRVLIPAGRRLTAIGRRFTPQDRVERLTRRMELAGMPREWTVDRVLAGKALGLVGLGVGAFALLLIVGRPLWAVALGVGMAALGWYLPEIILTQMAQKRSQRIQRELPDTLDLLTISVEAGMGFDAALGNVARNSSGPLADEFFRVLHEMQLGTGRMDALKSLSDRTDVADLRVFVTAMAQADAFGIPVANVLRAQGEEMRVKRGQRAEERAMKIPVKMVFPLMLFILPSLLIVILGPAVIRIFEDVVKAV